MLDLRAGQKTNLTTMNFQKLLTDLKENLGANLSRQKISKSMKMSQNLGSKAVII